MHYLNIFNPKMSICDIFILPRSYAKMFIYDIFKMKMLYLNIFKSAKMSK